MKWFFLLLAGYLLIFFSRSAWALEEARDLKNQKRSLIRWGELDPDDWINYRLWKNDRARRDKEPLWETRVRERNSKELVGRVVQCVGICRVFRGEAFFSTEFRSAIREGDEIFTIGESYVWIFMLDGTLVRLSPDSSMTFKELNIGTKENFLHARLNSGNILWLSRSGEPIKETNLRETDTLFLPLSFYEANPSKAKIKKVDEDSLFSLLESPKDNLRQVKRLNKLTKENNDIVKNKPTFSFLIMPNGTVSGYNLNMEFVIQIGAESFLKRRSFANLGYITDKDEKDVTFYFRGLENTQESSIDVDQWYKVEKRGRSISKFYEKQKFSVGEYITRRIHSILVARELMLRRYSKFIFEEELNPKIVADNGYRLWGKLNDEEKKADLTLRLEFLKEYTRRTETTNLLSAERFRKKLEKRGENLEGRAYGPRFYTRALLSLIRRREQDRQGDADSDREVLNSTQKRFWKILHDIK